MLKESFRTENIPYRTTGSTFFGQAFSETLMSPGYISGVVVSDINQVHALYIFGLVAGPFIGGGEGAYWVFSGTTGKFIRRVPNTHGIVDTIFNLGTSYIAASRMGTVYSTHYYTNVLNKIGLGATATALIGEEPERNESWVLLEAGAVSITKYKVDPKNPSGPLHQFSAWAIDDTKSAPPLLTGDVLIDGSHRDFRVFKFSTGELKYEMQMPENIVAICLEDADHCYILFGNRVVILFDYVRAEVLGTAKIPPLKASKDYWNNLDVMMAWDPVYRRLLLLEDTPDNPDKSCSMFVRGFRLVNDPQRITRPIPLKVPRQGRTIPVLVQVVDELNQGVGGYAVDAQVSGFGTLVGTPLTGHRGDAFIQVSCGETAFSSPDSSPQYLPDYYGNACQSGPVSVVAKIQYPIDIIPVGGGTAGTQPGTVTAGTPGAPGSGPTAGLCRLGFSWFWLMAGLKYWPAQVESNLNWIVANLKPDFVRVFACVGGVNFTTGSSDGLPHDPWQYAGAFRSWSDWGTLIQRTTDMMFDKGIKVEWTLLGGLGQTPTDASQDQLVRDFAGYVSTRLNKLELVEMMNEYGTNGADIAMLRRMAKVARPLLGTVPISLSSPESTHGSGSISGEVQSMYFGQTEANAITPHWNRAAHVPPALGSYAPGIVYCNEPRGPGASAGGDMSDPTILAGDYQAAINAKYTGYVYHTDWGIWDKHLHEAFVNLVTHKGEWENMTDIPNNAAIVAALKAKRTGQTTLPPGTPPGTPPPGGSVFPPPIAPNMMGTLTSVLASGHWDLSDANKYNANGQGKFVEAAVTAMHDQDAGFGHLHKYGTSTQYNGHAVDATVYKRSDGKGLESIDFITSTGSLAWQNNWFYTDNSLWYYPA